MPNSHPGSQSRPASAGVLDALFPKRARPETPSQEEEPLNGKKNLLETQENLYAFFSQSSLSREERLRYMWCVYFYLKEKEKRLGVSKTVKRPNFNALCFTRVEANSAALTAKALLPAPEQDDPKEPEAFNPFDETGPMKQAEVNHEPQKTIWGFSPR